MHNDIHYLAQSMEKRYDCAYSNTGGPPLSTISLTTIPGIVDLSTFIIVSDNFILNLGKLN